MIGQNQEQSDARNQNYPRKKWVGAYGKKSLVGSKTAEVKYEICYKGIDSLYLREFPEQVEKLGFPVERRDADNIILVWAPSGKVPMQNIASLVDLYKGNLKICANGKSEPISVDLKKAASGLFEYRFPEQKK